MKQKTYRLFIYVIAAISAALLGTVGMLYVAPVSNNAKPNSTTSPSSTKGITGAATELRRIVDASIATLGTTGWVQVNEGTGKRVFFDPSYKGEYKVAARESKTSEPYVEGSMFEVVPFELMDLLERTPQELKVSKTNDIFMVSFVDSMAKGTAVTEYKIENGLIVSKTIRDHVGKSNEVHSLVSCHYGLDAQAKADLDFANQHQIVGND